VQGTATIDGEAVVCCPKTGLSLFDSLHSGRFDREIILCGFDLLELNGTDFRPLRLEQRKAKLAELLRRLSGGIELSEYIEADGATVFRHACKLGCEGIVSKRRDAPYRSGRVRTWIKVKNPASPAMARAWER
jgi:ATP-dependent DNA ligase